MRFNVSAGQWGGGLFACLLLFTAPVHAASEAETAELLTKLMQVGRSVVSEHQDLINDAGRGNKGFTPEYLAERMIQQYKEKTNIDLSRPSATPQSGLLLTLLESGQEVVAEAQPIINKQGVAFKGFIPALWGRRTAEKFTKRTGIRLKLTALEYRFPGNRPDDFEAEALRVFSDPGYPKGKGYSKLTMMDGRQVLRLITPEYAVARCLMCHGEPRGERDITGMKREGLKEGDLAGAISLAIPVR
jgi:general secretion pathway protein A